MMTHTNRFFVPAWAIVIPGSLTTLCLPISKQIFKLMSEEMTEPDGGFNRSSSSPSSNSNSSSSRSPAPDQESEVNQLFKMLQYFYEHKNDAESDVLATAQACDFPFDRVLRPMQAWSLGVGLVYWALGQASLATSRNLLCMFGPVTTTSEFEEWLRMTFGIFPASLSLFILSLVSFSSPQLLHTNIFQSTISNLLELLKLPSHRSSLLIFVLICFN
jgi:hypothetical protein